MTKVNFKTFVGLEINRLNALLKFTSKSEEEQEVIRNKIDGLCEAWSNYNKLPQEPLEKSLEEDLYKLNHEENDEPMLERHQCILYRDSLKKLRGIKTNKECYEYIINDAYYFPAELVIFASRELSRADIHNAVLVQPINLEKN